MTRIIAVLALVALAGCSSSTAPTSKVDPYLTIRVRDQLDTTAAPGKTLWHVYMLLTGPYTAQNGIASAGTIGLVDVRAHHEVLCTSVIADFVGQRLLTVLAIGDTATGDSPDATARAIVTDWYNGNHTLPSGWIALTFTPQDAFASAQFNAGHGLIPSDPIKWGFDWTATGTTSFYERSDSDSTCSTV